jgi:hypothetical protein
MSWYKAIADNTAIGDHFESLWFAKGSPKDAALFGIRDVRHMHYEYYFNPEAALLDPDFVRKVAIPCDTPDIHERGLILLVGDHYKASGSD